MLIRPLLGVSTLVVFGAICVRLQCPLKKKILRKPLQEKSHFSHVQCEKCYVWYGDTEIINCLVDVGRSTLRQLVSAMCSLRQEARGSDGPPCSP